MPTTLTRARLAEALHARVGVSKKEAASMVEDVVGLLCEALVAGERVKLSTFGTFEVREKAPRPGRNPRTNEPLLIERRRVVTFRPSQVLRAAMNEAGGRE